MSAASGGNRDVYKRQVLGWKREMLFPETGLYWMMPSPAIPNFETALLYPGTCLPEATNISEGRGTSAPFELIGAPFINGAASVSYTHLRPG